MPRASRSHPPMNDRRARGPGALPSVDRLLRHERSKALIEGSGRGAVTDAIRDVLARVRTSAAKGGGGAPPSERELLTLVAERLDAAARPSLREVFNLTGTVLHTNLGRAPLPRQAVEAMAA